MHADFKDPYWVAALFAFSLAFIAIFHFAATYGDSLETDRQRDVAKCEDAALHWIDVGSVKFDAGLCVDPKTGLLYSPKHLPEIRP